MTYKFLKAIDIIFGNEGGYSNHRNDKGGATNFGITQATLREACNKKLTTIDKLFLFYYNTNKAV